MNKIQQIQAPSAAIDSVVGNVNKNFQDVLNTINESKDANGINAQNITPSNMLRIQQDLYKFTIYNEMVTKIVSKTVTSVNEVMKSQ